MEEKTYYAFCYLNQANLFARNKGWQASTIFDHFPTKEEILNGSTALSPDNENDVRLAELLIQDKGEPARIQWESDKYPDWFFEAAIFKIDLGENLNLWDLFTTGYADMTNRIIKGK